MKGRLLPSAAHWDSCFLHHPLLPRGSGRCPGHLLNPTLRPSSPPRTPGTETDLPGEPGARSQQVERGRPLCRLWSHCCNSVYLAPRWPSLGTGLKLACSQTSTPLFCPLGVSRGTFTAEGAMQASGVELETLARSLLFFHLKF